MAKKINDFEKIKKTIENIGPIPKNLKKHFGMNTKIVFVNFIQKRMYFSKN